MFNTALRWGYSLAGGESQDLPPVFYFSVRAAISHEAKTCAKAIQGRGGTRPYQRKPDDPHYFTGLIFPLGMQA